MTTSHADQHLLLRGAPLRTYEKLFQHPLTHNLEWRELRAMLDKMGQVIDESNSHIAFHRNGQSLVLHRPHGKDLTDVHELMEIRHFLERSDSAPPAPDSDAFADMAATHQTA